MKTISRAVLAGALVVGAGGMVASVPAIAKDKKNDQTANQPKLSNEVRTPAAAAQTALAANDLAAAETAIAQAEAAAKTDDETYITSALRLQLEANKLRALENNPQAYAQGELALAGPLDRLIANPRTPQTEIPKYTYLRGKVAFDNGKFADALPLLSKAQSMGYQSPDLAMEIVQAKSRTGDTAGAAGDIEKQIAAETAAGRKAPEDWYKFAISRYNSAGNRQAVNQWLQKWVAAYPTSKTWRDAVLTYGFSGASSPKLSKAQQVDLFRLLKANNALLDRAAYLEYAQDTIDMGLPTEAKTVLEAGAAKGMLPASDSSAKALLADANRAIASEGSLASLATKAQASKDGKLAQQTADAYLGQGDYAKAAELYRTALGKGGVDTNSTNLHLGQALALSGDKAGAQTAFQAVSGAPNSDIASFWQVYLTSPATA